MKLLSYRKNKPFVLPLFFWSEIFPFIVTESSDFCPVFYEYDASHFQAPVDSQYTQESSVCNSSKFLYIFLIHRYNNSTPFNNLEGLRWLYL